MPDRAMTHPGTMPAPARLSRLGLAVLLTGAFVVVFDTFVVNVAIPSLRIDLGADLAETGMVIAAYALTFGACLIVGGRLGDIAGRRRVFALGMFGFAVSSLLCGLAASPLLLIAARVLQGLCGAMLFPQVYALLRALNDDHGRTRAFGLLGMTLGLAAIAGQLLGGLMVWCDLFGLGWRVIFFVNVPVGIAATLSARSIPESTASHTDGIDLPGAGLATGGLILLLVPLFEGPEFGWPLWTAVSLICGLALLCLFWRREHDLARAGMMPLIDPAIILERNFLLSILTVLLVYSTPASFFLCFMMTVQTGLSLNPLEAGSLLTPMSIGFIAASLAAPTLTRRFGASALIAGMTLYTFGFLWLRSAVPSLSGKAGASSAYIIGMVLFGLGQGLSGPPLLNVAIGFVDKQRAGMAGGVISTMQQLGAAFGIALANMIFGQILALEATEPAPQRYANAFSAAVLLNIAVMVIAVSLMMGIRITPPHRRRS